MPSKYFIAVETRVQDSITDLVKDLQAAFDGGAAGFFQVIKSRSSTCFVLFERDAGDDQEIIRERLGRAPDLELNFHLAQQLAAELVEGGAAGAAVDVIDALRDGQAQVFDFGAGTLDSMRD